MAIWQYEGTNSEGQFARGETDAETKEEAQQKLKQQGVSVLQLKKKQKELELVIPGLTDGVPIKNMVIFTRQMATMIDAGLPLVQCLDLVGNAEPNPNLKKAVLGVKASVEAGNVCIQTHGGFGFAEEYDVERKFRETRLYQVAPISTNLILSFLAEHVLGMPRPS